MSGVQDKWSIGYEVYILKQLQQYNSTKNVGTMEVSNACRTKDSISSVLSCSFLVR